MDHTPYYGKISSQSGVQQGDSLGPMLFALVLKKLVSSIEADDEFFRILLNAWYLDDGVLAGNRSNVVSALYLIEELGPHLGLHINISKCKLFSRIGNSFFPSTQLRNPWGTNWGLSVLFTINCREMHTFKSFI